MEILIIVIEIIQLIFIILKACNVVKFGWGWVTAPTWLSILFVIILVIIQKIKDWKDGYR